MPKCKNIKSMPRMAKIYHDEMKQKFYDLITAQKEPFSYTLLIQRQHNSEDWNGAVHK